MTHYNVTDIVGRLRANSADCSGHEPSLSLLQRTAEEAADTIATLRKQLENAREALRQCRNAVKGGKDEPRRNVREIVDEALGQKTTLGGELANQYIEDQQP